VGVRVERPAALLHALFELLNQLAGINVQKIVRRIVGDPAESTDETSGCREDAGTFRKVTAPA